MPTPACRLLTKESATRADRIMTEVANAGRLPPDRRNPSVKNSGSFRQTAASRARSGGIALFLGNGRRRCYGLKIKAGQQAGTEGLAGDGRSQRAGGIRIAGGE